MEDLTLDDALGRVLEHAATTRPVAVDLLDALGCVAATDVVSPIAVPVAAVSAMDGFAVRRGDVDAAPRSLRVVGVVPAGRPLGRGLTEGEAARILTGGVLPDGADAVVRAEDASVHLDHVEILLAPSAGDHVRPAGDSLSPGDVLVEAGTSLGPAHLALAASAGLGAVEVHRRPRVAVIGTGDELVAPGEGPLGPGEIHDANSTLLAASLDAAGCRSEVHRCGDDPAALAELVDDAAGRCDVVLTSGGVSMGDEYDVVLSLARSHGLEIWRLAIKPGKPMVHGTIGDTHLVGLPGNPVAAAVVFELLVRPLLRRLAGRIPAVPPPLHGVAGAPIGRVDEGRVQLVRVRRNAEGAWEPTGAQGSHQLRGLAVADGLARVDPGQGPLPLGAEVSVVALGG